MIRRVGKSSVCFCSRTLSFSLILFNSNGLPGSGGNVFRSKKSKWYFYYNDIYYRKVDLVPNELNRLKTRGLPLFTRCIPHLARDDQGCHVSGSILDSKSPEQVMLCLFESLRAVFIVTGADISIKILSLLQYARVQPPGSNLRPQTHGAESRFTVRKSPAFFHQVNLEKRSQIP